MAQTALVAGKGVPDVPSQARRTEAACSACELGTTVREAPWGHDRVTDRGDGYLVKILTINPHAMTSLQYHEHRAGTWVVVGGALRAWWGEERFEDFTTGARVHVERGAIHRVENPGPEPLVMVEVWVGNDLRESDVVRLHDIYGRI